MPFTSLINKQESFHINETDHCVRIEEFLQKFNIIVYKLIKIDIDASKRCYYRVMTANHSYILMDASQEIKSVTPFIKVAKMLIENSINAPKIFLQDLDKGFLLLEDFGESSFAKILQANNTNELELYLKAVEVLIKLKNIKADNLPIKDKKLFMEGIYTFNQHYINHKLAESIAKVASKEIINAFNKIFDRLLSNKMIFTLRDYHAENLMWMSNKAEDKVGVLDFQDAALGYPTYDLVSLLEDARRDVNSEVVRICKENYFLAFDEIERKQLEELYSIFSLQRNLRIVGAFHRLNLIYNKDRYITFLPRVWGYIRKTIIDLHFKQVKEIFDKYHLYEY